jgi:hypothetical protein
VTIAFITEPESVDVTIIAPDGERPDHGVDYDMVYWLPCAHAYSPSQMSKWLLDDEPMMTLF